MRFEVVLASTLICACAESSAVLCPDGVTTCPAQSQCTDVQSKTYCVTDEQVKSCDGVPEGTACTTDTIASGGCHGGACFEAVCPNGLQDPDEACDDGNDVAGDGCSPGCDSIEACGNAITDGVMLEQCDDGNLTSHDGCDSRCQREAPMWSRFGDDDMQLSSRAPLSDFAMTYDEAHGMVVLFGGAGGPSGFLNDTWLWNGKNWRRATSKVSPSPRMNAAMAYDASRRRVVLFGGKTPGGNVSDTWEWDGNQWELRPTGTQPSARAGAGMAYDSGHRRIVLFGGDSGETVTYAPFKKWYSDTWTWDGAAWTFRNGSAVSPEPRERVAMAYDPKRHKVVLYGGYGIAIANNAVAIMTTTWELDDLTWTLVSSTPPSPEVELRTALVWDPIGEHVILMGGRDSSDTVPYQYTFAWTGSAWAPLADAPIARAFHAMASDTTRKRVVAYGGAGTSLEIDEWDGTMWTNVSPYAHLGEEARVATDWKRGVAVMLDDAGETWELDGHGWKNVGATPPGLRSGFAMTYDAARGDVLLFGGFYGTTEYQDTWRYDYQNRTWEQIAATGPSPRRYPAMAYDSKRQRVVLFGGRSGNTLLDDTWLWDGTAWSQVSPAHKAYARYQGTLAYDPDRDQMVLFGGYDDILPGVKGYPAITAIWDGNDWNTMQIPNPPSLRRLPSMAWDPARRRIVLYGGDSGALSGILQDAWEWTGTGWELLRTDQLPINRYGAAMFSDPRGAGVVMYGGDVSSNSGITPAADTWLLRWEGTALDEACREAGRDDDGDGRTSCADVDCWAQCTPDCPPGTSCTTPGCGDGFCNAALETCRLCPADCGACTPPVCGDFHCDPGEACPGDCP